jgi:hypothetical protein
MTSASDIFCFPLGRKGRKLLNFRKRKLCLVLRRRAEQWACRAHYSSVNTVVWVGNVIGQLLAKIWNSSHMNNVKQNIMILFPSIFCMHLYKQHGTDMRLYVKCIKEMCYRGVVYMFWCPSACFISDILNISWVIYMILEIYTWKKFRRIPFWTSVVQNYCDMSTHCWITQQSVAR